MSLKKILNGVKSGVMLIVSWICCMFASVVIGISGMDKADDWPTPAEIEKQNEWAKKLQERHSDKDNK